MGRHTDRAVIGSPRAAVATLTLSAVLVIGGLAIHHASTGQVPGQSSTPSVPAATPSSHVADVIDPGRTPSTSPGPPRTTAPRSTLPVATTSPSPSTTSPQRSSGLAAVAVGWPVPVAGRTPPPAPTATSPSAAPPLAATAGT